LQITFGGKNAGREAEIVEVAEFIGVKSHKARGKRLTSYEVENITEMEPIIKDEDEQEQVVDEEPEVDADDDIPFEINRKKKDDEEDDKNQMSLF
jgi:topoisomerase-4 subunit A